MKKILQYLLAIACFFSHTSFICHAATAQHYNPKHHPHPHNKHNALKPTSQTKQTKGKRDVPIYFATDLHMHREALEGVAKLTDGIVVLNGDTVVSVNFDTKQGKLKSGSANINRTKPGTPTDPQTAIDILAKRKHPKYPLIMTIGNHERNPYAYKNCSISDTEDWIQALQGVNAHALSTFPDYSYWGTETYIEYENTYFFSYLTAEYGWRDVGTAKGDTDQYLNQASLAIAQTIQQVCDSKTREIVICCHAGVQEGRGLIKKLVPLLFLWYKQKLLSFNPVDVHFLICYGHAHGGSINGQWKGKIDISIPSLKNPKPVREIFPNCANDCIEVSPKGERSLKCQFMMKDSY